jgi:predicted RNA-binding protein
MMCEAIVYIVKDGDKQQIMENVVTIRPDGERLLLTDLFGEQKLITASVDRVDLIGHEIYLK